MPGRRLVHNEYSQYDCKLPFQKVLSHTDGVVYTIVKTKPIYILMWYLIINVGLLLGARLRR